MRTDAPQPLFRDEAVRGQATRLLGDVALAAPLGARVLLPVLTAMVVALATFAFVQEYPRTETARGYVTASVGVSKLHPARAGTVSGIFVEVGARVDAGDVLLTIASNDALASGDLVGEELRAELLAQRAQLELKLTSEEGLFAERVERGMQRASALETELEQLRRLRLLAVERCAIAAAQVAKSRTLRGKGVIADTQLQKDQDQALQLDTELRQLDRTLLQKQDEAASVAHEARTAPLEHDKSQADLRMALADIASRLTELESRSSFAVKAPVSGRVAALQASLGASADPTLPIAVILPEGGRLEANVLIPPRAIGFLEPGQKVAIKYAAFPYQKFGVQRARVDRVEATVLNPEELRTPVSTQEPVYRMVATLDAQSVRAYGKSYPLQLGMLLEAEIVLERRTILQWLLDPLYSLRSGMHG